MITEAELFVKAETMLLEVLGRIRPGHHAIVVPPLFDVPGADRPRPLPELVAHYARDDAWVPDLLAGATMAEVGEDEFDGDLLGADPQASLTKIVDAARAAAATVDDPDKTVHSSFGDVSTSTYLWQLNIARCFIAHDVAMALGSRACPLPEDLAKGMYDGLEPDRQWWQDRGVFREPLPLPDGHVSWRDQFLLMAGRDPHPFLDD